MIAFYGYNKCATCRKAKAYLVNRGVNFREYDITVTPPSKTILHSIVQSGDYTIAELLNRSGEFYRVMNLKDKMKMMRETELIELLSKHGKLVKRPIITDGTKHTVGFDEVRMKRVWG